MYITKKNMMFKKLRIGQGKFGGQLTNSLRTCEIALAIIPSYFGSTGDSVNERQLVEALSKKIGRMVAFSFTAINQIFVSRKRTKKQSNVLLINLPSIPLPGISLIYSLLLSLLVFLLDKVYKFRFIYIRMSSVAFAFTLFKGLRDKLIVKIPALLEDELKFKTMFGCFICWLASLLDKVVLRNAAFIASPSPLLMREIIVRRRTFPKGRMIILPAGVNLEKIYKVKREIETAEKVREKGEFVIGFIGFLSWWQGVDILVKSVAKLRDIGLDKPVKLLLVGDGPERKRIEDLCMELKVDYLVTGFVQHDKALKYLSMFDVLVLPSYKISTTESNIPIKVIEAWALGIPVIVTRHKVFEFYGFKDHEDLVYCELTPESVAKALAKVLSSMGLREKLSEKGPQIAKHFNYELISKKIIDALKRGNATHG